jgi:hypothetical protein
MASALVWKVLLMRTLLRISSTRVFFPTFLKDAIPAPA